MRTIRTILLRFLPFWSFLLFFKFAATLHYTFLSPFGEQLLPLWIVGLLIGGESLVQVSLDIPAGHLLDRLGYRRMLAFSVVFFIIAAAFIVAGLTVETYILTVFFSIFGWLFYTPGINAYLLSETSEEESGRFFSLRDISNSIGVVLASILLPFALLLPVRLDGAILIVILSLALLCLIMSPREKKLPAHEHRTHLHHRHLRRHSPRKILDIMRRLNPASGMLVLLTFTGSLFYGVIWFTVPLVIALEQANAGLLGIGLGIFDFSVVMLGYLIGTMADRGDKRVLAFFGLLIFALCGMLAGVNFGILFILFGFLATAGDEMAGVSLWSWLHHLDREHGNDGMISGAITFFEDLGYGAGPILAGILYTLVGPSMTVMAGALPIFAAWVVYYIFVQRHFPYEALSVLVPHRPRVGKHKS